MQLHAGMSRRRPWKIEPNDSVQIETKKWYFVYGYDNSCVLAEEDTCNGVTVTGPWRSYHDLKLYQMEYVSCIYKNVCSFFARLVGLGC